MQPGRLVESVLEQDKDLSRININSFYQHEYWNIDSGFPYPDYILAQIGIPEQDIIHVVADKQDYYLELGN